MSSLSKSKIEGRGGKKAVLRKSGARVPTQWDIQGKITKNHEKLIESELFSDGFRDEDDVHTVKKMELKPYLEDLDKIGRNKQGLLHFLISRQHEHTNFSGKDYMHDRDIQLDEDESEDEQYELESEEDNIDSGPHEINNVKRLREFIEYLVIMYPSIICNPEDAPPIESFARSYPALLLHIIDMLPSDAEFKTLKQRCSPGFDKGATNDMRCPLWGLNRCLRDQFTKSQTGSSGSTPNDGFSCLHSIVDLTKIQDKVCEIRRTIREFISSAEDRRAHNQETLLHLILENANSFDSVLAKENFGWSSPEQLKSFKAFLDLFSTSENCVFNQENSKGYNPLQTAVLNFKGSSLNYGLLYKAIKILVHQQPSSIYFKAGSKAAEEHQGKTAYSLLRDLKVNKGEAERFKKKAEQFLKKVCIRQINPKDPSDREVDKIRYLYPTVSSERHIRLDLAHDTATIIDAEYVEILQEKAAMQFENILEYVRLPFRYPPHKPSETRTKDSAPLDKHKILDPYIDVFQWLRREESVQRIFKVEVDDLGPDPLNSTVVPHTDQAIRVCLNRDFITSQTKGVNGAQPNREIEKGLGVETWDWKKFDICSDTIRQAAPGVRILNLYSSGNIGVLKGWACKDGLRTLKKLEHVRLTIYPKNPKDEADCERYLPDFKAKLRKTSDILKEKHITIETDLRPAPGKERIGINQVHGQSGGHMNGASGVQTQDAWIQSIMGFKSCVYQILQGLQSDRPVVKVAIIDDGVILHDKHVQGIEKGASFGTTGQMYFGGNCQHGTHMVSSFREVCPMAKLYVGRLDDTRRNTNQRFTVESAILALEWAMDWKVDIISMSWSFKDDNNCGTPEAREKFKLTIDKAASQGIILFGAMPDRGPAEDITKRYPVGLRNVIRITAASATGERLPVNRTNSPELLFPGENVKITEGDADDEITGSSVATALAAGFAALILLCIRLQKTILD